MFKNFLKVAFRQLRKNRFYAIISISGLALSIGCCLLMLSYLQSEWSYDQQNHQPERLYRVVFENYLGQGKFATTPLPIGPALGQELPEVASVTRVAKGLTTLTRYQDKRFFENLAFIDTAFAEVFHLDFIEGDAATALATPQSVVISESYAKKYFGDANPIGKTLEIGSSGALYSTVSGVFRDFPQNTTVEFDLALPFSTFESAYGPAELWQQMPGNYTFFRLAEHTSIEVAEAKLTAFTERHLADQLDDWQQNYQMAFQPLLDIHLHSDYGRESSSGNLKTLYLLGLIALILLLIAGINYVNYTTARFPKRAKEVSIRKIIGANRRSLIGQFMMETVLTTALAGILAIVLANLFLPGFNLISGKSFQAADLNQPWFYASALAVIMLVGLIAGIFPALFLSGFRPLEAMKGKFHQLSMADLSRKGLVVGQFAASVILLVATLVVWQQMEYVRESIRPEVSEQVGVFQINGKLSEQFPILQEELQQVAGVERVAGGSNVATFTGDSWPMQLDLNSPKVQTENYAVQGAFLETMGYELIAGRSLDASRASDRNGAFVINETAVKAFDFPSAAAAVGERALFGSGKSQKEGQIIGVVKDFHFQSFHDQVEPAVIQFAPFDWMRSQFVAVRFQSDETDRLQTAVKEIVQTLDPNWHADLHFLDEQFMELHQNDLQQGRIFGSFALLAIFISCLGLLGLVTYSAEQRTKEIGIRKVLGASMAGIFRMLSMDFLRLVLIAFLIAVPISWYLMTNWLEGFTYRIDISVVVYLLAGISAFAIAMLAVSFQSLRAAVANPVESLRNE
ncbi:ABC transporter permease [Flavilitoribacter nigricans]|uniref:FtsX-like permease family protein n=1 Tax=Flavilitoribacter nigricans (strain ATCC 23147 / DSM 23189 / NBRC 102662 / NCIMB 1420 / SS-2) TaxID=1122177 RepID=A0A2D0N1D0_FLAN2|nr:ABC transporter permease [Flavilitoribacter nigricans]PHN01939.1 hypothetical protein CRP01_34675 [Flavilitoribacter nigricans DSM 23189 = NBRC 102662]